MAWMQLTFVDFLECFAEVAHPPKGPRLIYSASAKRIKRRQNALTIGNKRRSKTLKRKWSEFMNQRMEERAA